MNSAIRHVGILLVGCFLLLFAQLNRVQIFSADDLKENTLNTRTIKRNFNRPRGPITTGDGVVVARSVEAENSTFDQQREYPEGDLYAHITGFLSFSLGARGVEKSYNDELIGSTASLQLTGLTQLLGGGDPAGEVILTIDHKMQTMARELLGERQGSVVVLNAKTGEVLTLWSFPSFDPNKLAVHGADEAAATFAQLLEADGNPLRARSFREIFFPGSTFKLVTAAGALSNDVVNLTDPVFPVSDSYLPPKTTRPIANFGGSSCGGNLLEIVRVSCNGPFAEIGAELLGPERLAAQAEAFGFNDVPPIDIPDAAASNFPTDFGARLGDSTKGDGSIYENTPAVAQSAIGQNDVSATPLQMALVAAAIAADGDVPSPHVVSEVRDVKGTVVDSVDPSTWRRAVEPDVAADLRETMVGVVEEGTASEAQVEGVVVGGKTGTAQLGTDPPRSHAWFLAFAGRPEADPELAIAVMVEGQEGSSEQTGGRVSAPIAAALIDEYFSR